MLKHSTKFRMMWTMINLVYKIKGTLPFCGVKNLLHSAPTGGSRHISRLLPSFLTSGWRQASRDPFASNGRRRNRNLVQTGLVLMIPSVYKLQKHWFALHIRHFTQQLVGCVINRTFGSHILERFLIIFCDQHGQN